MQRSPTTRRKGDRRWHGHLDRAAQTHSADHSTVPHLWDLKQTILKLQKRLSEMGDAELLDFTLEYGFPAVFTIITINPFVAPMSPRMGGGGLRRPPVPPRGLGSMAASRAVSAKPVELVEPVEPANRRHARARGWRRERGGVRLRAQRVRERPASRRRQPG